MGGGSRAQAIAAIGTAVAPLFLTTGHFLGTVTVELVAGAGIALLVVRLINGADPRWWVAVGVACGVALLNKWTIAPFVVALAGALLAGHGARHPLHPLDGGRCCRHRGTGAAERRVAGASRLAAARIRGDTPGLRGGGDRAPRAVRDAERCIRAARAPWVVVADAGSGRPAVPRVRGRVRRRARDRRRRRRQALLHGGGRACVARGGCRRTAAVGGLDAARSAPRIRHRDRAVLDPPAAPLDRERGARRQSGDRRDDRLVRSRRRRRPRPRRAPPGRDPHRQLRRSRCDRTARCAERAPPADERPQQLLVLGAATRAARRDDRGGAPTGPPRDDVRRRARGVRVRDARWGPQRGARSAHLLCRDPKDDWAVLWPSVRHV
ncbi:MAG: hypothetical protein KatS3mg009_1098 [Acidimicrobiia bacterium]|nr:MAG: hypothetical protein KatS3mg009_1098 [Acidimicrobiia bacterium]